MASLCVVTAKLRIGRYARHFLTLMGVGGGGVESLLEFETPAFDRRDFHGSMCGKLKLNSAKLRRYCRGGPPPVGYA